MKEIWFISVTVAIVACGGSGTGGWEGAVRDSAGIEIVENPGTGVMADNPPVLEEDLRIGTVEGDVNYQFGTVAGIDVDAAGRVYVLDRQAFKVRVYDAEGTFLREMGRQGTGPGELSRATSNIFLTAGDTVLVVDGLQQRITRYTAAGEAVGSTPFNLMQGLPLRWDQLPNGDVVTQVRINALPSEITGTSGEMADLLVVRGSDAIVRDTLLELPAGGTFNMSGGSMQMRMFDPEPMWTLMTDGSLAFGMNDTYRIELRGPDGTLQRIATKAFTRRPVTEEDKEEILEAIIRTTEQLEMPAEVPAEARSQLVDMIRSMIRIGDYFPAFAAFFGGPNHTLWVQQVPSAEEIAETGIDIQTQNVGSPDWDLFDAQGRFLATVTMPDRFTPMLGTQDAIYGVWRDELDVQHVVRLRLTGM